MIVSTSVINWGIVLIPVIASLYSLLCQILEQRKHRRLLRVMNRYLTVLGTLDDFMKIAMVNIEAPSRIMSEAIDKVRSLNPAQASDMQELQATLKTFTSVAQQAPRDNETSALRSSGLTQAPQGAAGNPFKSWLVWLVIVVSFGGFITVQLVASLSSSLKIVDASVLIVGIVLLLLMQSRLSKTISSRKLIERQAALLAQNFNVRREYVYDAHIQFQQFVKLFQKFAGQMSSIPQARGFLKGISWLNAICHRLESAHSASNLTVDAPLFAVTAYLRKLAEQDYATLATDHGVTLRLSVSDGLAFRITPQDFNQLMTSIVDNAMKFSKPGGEVVVSGSRRFGRTILKVIDKGSGIADDQMRQLFDASSATPDSKSLEAPALSLHINKIIMARVGGELKVSSKPQEGTVVTIVAPKSRRREDLRIPTRILKSTSPLG